MIEVLLPYPRHPDYCIKLFDMKLLVKQIYDINEILEAMKNKHHYAHEHRIVKHYSYARNKEFLIIYACKCTSSYIERHFEMNPKLSNLSTENSVSNTYANVVKLHRKFHSILNKQYTQYFDNMIHLNKQYLDLYKLERQNDEIEDPYNVDMRYFDRYVKDVINTYTPIFYTSDISFIKRQFSKINKNNKFLMTLVKKATQSKLLSSSVNSHHLVETTYDELSSQDLKYQKQDHISSYRNKQRFTTTNQYEVAALYQIKLNDYNERKHYK